MDRLEYVLNKLPAFYNKDEQDSRVRAVVKAFTDEMALYDDQYRVVDDAVGIGTTQGPDIDVRWGGLLDMPRNAGEDDTTYRNRIMASIPNLAGGTRDSIRYAIAVVLGINTNQAEMTRLIDVEDAWLYDGAETIDRSKGCVVCTIDLDGGAFQYKDSISTVVQRAIDDTKASGTKVQLIFKNYRVETYNQMQSSSYMQLSTFRYNQLGDTV
jgi:hypothetical protein